MLNLTDKDQVSALDLVLVQEKEPIAGDFLRAHGNVLALWETCSLNHIHLTYMSTLAHRYPTPIRQHHRNILGQPRAATMLPCTTRPCPYPHACARHMEAKSRQNNPEDLETRPWIPDPGESL